MAEVEVYVGEALGRYGFGDGHPFGPDRLGAFWRKAEQLGLAARVTVAAPVAASEDAIARFHGRTYIARVRSQSASGSGFLDYGDTPAAKGIYEAAATVCGSSLAAVARAVSGAAPRAFVPIGGLHHARRDGAAGFCVFNDIGVAIETLRAVHGVRRVAYVDIDAHHGDGVFYAYETDPEVIVADIHEDGRWLYPGTGSAAETGKGAAHGTKRNVPLPPGSGDDVFQRAFLELEAFVRSRRPEIILFVAGTDSIAGDPVAHLELSTGMHGWAAGRLRAIADEVCGGRLVAFGAGGYDRHNLALGWTGVVSALL